MIRDILGHKCRKCGTLHYPIRTRCKKCGHTEWEKGNIVYDFVPLPKAGKLLTFTHAYALPPQFELTHLTLGIVELDGGQRITGQLKIADPKIGMRVKGEVEVVRKDDYKKDYGIVFYTEG
ncbi:MAG TPA: OB-fold domain-containing protein [Myxococcales bacterium]|jgi:hypothetical protein